MKMLIVFYSLEGNCQLVVDELGKHLQADVLRLFPVNDIKPNGFGRYLWGGHQALKHDEPPLKPYTVDLSHYETVIIGTPVWAGTYAPALRTFLAHHAIKDKKVAFFACYAGIAGKTFSQLKTRLVDGNTVLGEKAFKDPTKQDRTKLALAVQQWAETLTPAPLNP